MKECCLIPVFDRPEFAMLCVEHIKKNSGIEGISFIFCVDLRIGEPFHEDLFRVIEGFGWDNVAVKFSAPHSYRGNSFNLLTSIKTAAERGFDLIHLLEDDVMVSDDYFDWHRKAHEYGDFFASVASKSPRSPEFPDILEDFMFSAIDYAPYGVCFNAEKVKEHLLPHIKTEYFDNMGDYVSKNFPSHPLGGSMHEQDGLIYRIVTTNSLYCAFPKTPRCYHAGFYGYNRRRSPKPRGTLEEKIEYIRSVMHDKDALNALSWEFPDLEPCELDVSRSKLIQ